jgi:hypothetical protein
MQDGKPAKNGKRHLTFFNSKKYSMGVADIKGISAEE